MIKHAVQNGFWSDLGSNITSDVGWGAGIGAVGGAVGGAGIGALPGAVLGGVGGFVTGVGRTVADHTLKGLTGRDFMSWGGHLWDKGLEKVTGQTRLQREGPSVANPWASAQQSIHKPDMATRRYTEAMTDAPATVAALRAPGKPGMLRYQQSQGAIPTSNNTSLQAT